MSIIECCLLCGLLCTFDNVQKENTALHFAAMAGLQRCVEVIFFFLFIDFIS